MKCYSGPNLPRTHARPVFGEPWLNHHYGMEFGERYHLDPVFRTEQDREALRVIDERFGSLGIGERDPRPRPHLDICGHRFVPALLGCEIVYQDSHPAAAQHTALDPEVGLSGIGRPDLATNRWAEEFRLQAMILVDR